jgi:hypothetical protein
MKILVPKRASLERDELTAAWLFSMEGKTDYLSIKVMKS